MQAQLHLATAYYIQWVPGDDSTENRRKHDLTAKQFQAVLDKDPNNSLALAMMASMAYNSATSGSPEEKAAALDDAAHWNERRVTATPDEAEPYYFLGVIAWTKVYAPIQKARLDAAMKPTDPGPIIDPAVRSALQSPYWKTIEGGIANLKRALELEPSNEDAMTYMNLLLRKKADLEDSPNGAKADIEQAEEWADKAIKTRKAKAKQSPGAADGVAQNDFGLVPEVSAAAVAAGALASLP